MYKRRILFAFFSIFFLSSMAQKPLTTEVRLQWFTNSDVASDRPIWCEGCLENYEGETIFPLYTKTLDLGERDINNVNIQSVSSKLLDIKGLEKVSLDEYTVHIDYIRIKGKRKAVVSFQPFKNNSGQLELLEAFNLSYELGPLKRNTASIKKKKDQTYTSALSTRESYKIGVTETGVYRLDKAFFDAHSIPISDLDLGTFNVYGNGGLMLPEVIATNRAEDLIKNAIKIHDANANNTLDDGDYILWYAQGPSGFKYNHTLSKYGYSKNDYEDLAYYFIQWGESSSNNIITKTSNQGSSIDLTMEDYDYMLHHENDDINHIHSGRKWWGDEMAGNQTDKSFSYTVPGIVANADMTLESSTSARSLAGSYIRISIDGVSGNVNHSAVSGEFDANYTAGPKYRSLSTTVTSDRIDVLFEYSRPLSDSKAWIDYFNVFTNRTLNAYDLQQEFMATNSLINGNVEYVVGSAQNHEIWDVTEQGLPTIQQTYDKNGKKAFIAASDQNTLRKYHLFDLSAVQHPSYIGKTSVQNLHGITQTDYLIVTHPDFKADADRLAEFHRTYSNLKVDVVDVHAIYNEFSSGSQDVTAIRDFAKLLYDRGNDLGKPLQFVLLFGDASYDFKNRIDNNTNFVPIYQSFNSFLPSASHCSDDYYGILDDDEGYWGLSPAFEGMDIGVGRLPVSSAFEAQLMVDKILHYHNSSFGNWVNKLSFLGDDEDYNVHFSCSEDLTNIISTQNPKFNINKIWLDAHEQVSFGSGNKYPTVNSEVDKAIEQGTLIFNYVGHGGTNGMAHERVVTRPQISNWQNYDRLSFYITASCELAAIDNPAQKSPGELMLFNPEGGAIGMVATTRVVFIGANCDLNEDILSNNIFNIVGNRSKALGDVYMDTRNRSNTGQTINKRSFMLFADPAMGLLTPPHKVIPTKINGLDFQVFTDTLTALSKVTIEGEIRDYNNNLMNSFNGILYPTIYDKKATYQTRGNDPKSLVVNFDAQSNIIYKGKISANSGKFSFSFVVPKDIAYHIGEGKISFYAEDGTDHAGGYDGNIKIGGTSDSIETDHTPPDLQLYIDDRSWVFGGSTNFTPLLLADINDENGINTVGSGIGREMEAILDEGTENEQLFILNEYFQPELNSYQSGEINYRFDELEPGTHTIRLKVWDVYNNSAEAYTEFVVGSDDELNIDHLLNYPNPFSTFTTFHFDHNKAGQNLDVNLTIYTVAGQVVRSFTNTINNANTHSSDINWDGKDQFGDKLARGVYLYELQVKASDGSTQKRTQKLYIVN